MKRINVELIFVFTYEVLAVSFFVLGLFLYPSLLQYGAILGFLIPIPLVSFLVSFLLSFLQEASLFQ